ncbi:MAG: biopolymer transporter ExbD [Bacteriovoracaceae bacterium]|nr:biopolymer transporter ExbD [Bacteriovoracaceae bacterium]
MIDMVFLLLIFFLVTSVFRKKELALLLKLPEATQGKGDDKKQKDLTIELSDNEVAVNGQKSSMDDLEGWFKKSEPSTLVNLRVDGDVRYQRLVKVLDLLRTNKLDNISLITDKKK